MRLMHFFPIALFALILTAPIKAEAAVTCASTNAPAAIGGACSQLGETRMLPDGTAIIACVAPKDGSNACKWSATSSGGDGRSGTMCGMYIFEETRASWASGHEGTSTSAKATCMTFSNLPCDGKKVADFTFVRYGQTPPGPRSTRICLAPLDNSWGLNGDSAKYDYGQGTYYTSNCPDGYSIKKAKMAQSTDTLNSGSSTSTTYMLSCVKD